MAKMRVHELAKSLGKSSKDVLEYLNSTGLEVKSPQSGIEEDMVHKVEAHFNHSNKPASNPEIKKEEQKSLNTEKTNAVAKTKEEVKRGEVKSDESKSEAPKKKKSTITAVFNTQYSSHNGQRRDGQRKDGQRKDGQRRPNGERNDHKSRSNQNSQGQSRPLIKPRSGSGPIRADGTRKGEPTLAEQQKMRAAEEAKRSHEEEKKAASAPTPKTKEKVSPVENTASESRVEKKPIRRPNIYDNMPGGRPNGNNRNNDRNGNNRNGRPNGDNRNDFKRNDRNNNRSIAPSNEQNPNKESRKNSRRKNDNRRGKDSYNDKNQERFINLEKNGGKKPRKPQPQKPKEEEVIKSIKVPDHITLRELAERMHVEASQIIKKLFLQGVMITLNSSLDYEKAEEIALEYDILCEHEEKVDIIKDFLKNEEDDPKDLTPRPPVVSVMGHVDHGKTSLLDAIRDTSIANREAGGITQKIGAYVVESNGRKITFLDTPGHEAFTAMRMRGAKSTDIAVLVVAADDGVMPQTVESINHAKAAGVEVIVAVNKIDKPNANLDRVKQELSEYELIPEDWGGSTIFCPVSAKTHEGIDNLLEMILLTADVLELKANAKRQARGIVIEAQLDKGRGVVSTILVQNGTLHVGDAISAGSSYGKVRAMVDENGKRVKAAGPSVPVEIQGLNSVPNAGEIFIVHDSDRDARTFAQEFVNEEKNKLVEESRSRMSLENLSDQIKSGSLKELDIIVKADVQGSVEAVKSSLEKLSNDEVVVKIIHGGVGAITESDVVLASASNAIIIGFNVRPDAVAKDTAEREHVDVHLYSVIYNAIEDVESAMKGMLDPIYEERIIGHAEVRQTFKASGIGIIAGSFVTDGVIERGCKIRLKRGDKQLFDGDLGSLKRFKDDVKEVKSGYECGIVLTDYTSDIAEGDIMEAYKMVEVPRD